MTNEIRQSILRRAFASQIISQHQTFKIMAEKEISKGRLVSFYKSCIEFDNRNIQWWTAEKNRTDAEIYEYEIMFCESY